jgi:adenylate cyclase
MKTIKWLIVAVALTFAIDVLAQKHDTAFVNNLLKQGKGLMGTDWQKSIKLAEEAKETAHDINYPIGEATALKNIGLVYYSQQNYLQTLDYWTQSLEIFEAQKDDKGIANLLNNIGAVYKDQGVDDKALEYCLRSLTYAEKANDTLRLTAALGTIASIYHNKKDPQALGYLMKALKISGKEFIAVLYGNIGEVNYDLGEDAEKNHDLEKAANYFREALKYYEQSIKADPAAVSTAYSYNGIGKVNYKEGRMISAISSHEKAMAIAQGLGDKWNTFKAYQGIANANSKLRKNSAAMENYTKALKFAEEVENTDIADLYRDMYLAYESTGDWKNAFAYLRKLNEKQLEIYNSEEKKKMGRLDLTRNLDKKEAEVGLLTREKKIQQQQKIGFAAGLALILVIAIILFRNYKAKVKVNKILDKQKEQIEGLLLNILPAEVAKELQTVGKSTPRYHDDVAVLFTDFKGFTSIADRMSPADLVTQLNDCFIAFDGIIENYGLEKIKTIGDAYMCAAGIPSKGERNTYRIVKAAIEIQEWVIQNNKNRVKQGLEAWDIRIGVHTGPLVAGVVGKKKYAYDIWGTTVNIASRMESNGEPGRVNISAAAYELVKEDFECIYRGKINAKNIGEIDMFFVEKEFDKSYRVIGLEKQPGTFAGTTLN